MKRLTLLIVLMLMTAFTADAAVKTEDVTYTYGGVNFKGFIAYDTAIKGKRPGILVVHEWWGHNDHARNSAKKLAEEGYVALALDMYGDGKQADHPDTAHEFSQAVMQDIEGLGRERFLAALEVLKLNGKVDPDQIGAIGYCFGGGIVLHMARYGIDLKGVVSFHGSLGGQTSTKKGDIKSKILICHGADDPLVGEDAISGFKNEMDNAEVDYEIKIYPGARHSFTNPQADENGRKFDFPAIGYHEEAAKASWQDMLTFFNEVFNGEK